MALATTARLIHPCIVVSSSKNPRTPQPPLFIFHTHKPQTTTTLTSSSSYFRLQLHSVDVSKDDKPLDTAAAETKQEVVDDFSAPLPGELDEGEDGGPKLDPRRFEEQFAVLNTGVHECRSCGYLYDQAAGDPSYPVPRGLPFAKLPDDWRCPTCGAAQSFFDSKSVEIAGFAQNQQFGLGGNSLTSGQKTLLIYGSLLVGFAFFLSGYFLQ